ncbi:UDP-N-acetyl-D-glucosamine dehydrogenase [Litorivivens lipolytica]|uniref:UDP-N-acetyl-D-glucosamine dehydrogenase n=1 Tax=Litorivivens lipolytica TaxID=1524264 RepID=A0A7W4Z631_9GAMM|nr:nucleotide sugar dehydrogenase [Litorivivens lipolytica]MBB3047823.1 UDP-N-acetyl-D-glucosamine dehydrogenase [Litorivivens lipolytica]
MNEIAQTSPLTGEFTYVDLLEKIQLKEAAVSVVGQGYVGLPLAVAFAQSGFQVNGLDIDAERVSRLRQCDANSPDIEDSELARLSTSGHYKPSGDFSLLCESDVILICVPTPLRKSKDPDISYVIDVAETLAITLSPGKLIILESTTYPGTTEEVLLPLFEDKGLVCGRDFFLAFSPERIDPGNKQYSVSEIPKVTGGVTKQCTTLAAALYRQIVDHVVEVSSPKVAELAKLYENVFRSVNIALANEFSIMCRELNICSREVIDAAASKPFGFMPFYPGPGIGGHCIPVDPAYLAWKMRFSNYQARFIPLAEEINQSMPGHVVKLVNESLNRRKRCVNGARILALGVAYKAGVGDIRESPALGILNTLICSGAEISYIDPYVPSIDIAGIHFLSSNLTSDLLEKTDCILILTDHPSFDYTTILDSGKLVVDTRDATWGYRADAGQVVRL